MKHLKSYSKINEGLKEIVIGFATLIGVGITNISNAQKLSDNQTKLALVDTIFKYNQLVKIGDHLSLNKFVNHRLAVPFNIEEFKDRYLIEKNDRTFVFNPDFISAEIGYWVSDKGDFQKSFGASVSVHKSLSFDFSKGYFGATYKLDIPTKRKK